MAIACCAPGRCGSDGGTRRSQLLGPAAMRTCDADADAPLVAGDREVEHGDVGVGGHEEVEHGLRDLRQRSESRREPREPRSSSSWRAVVIAVARSSETRTAAMLDAATTTRVTVQAASHPSSAPLIAAAATHARATAIASPRPPQRPTTSATTASALPSAGFGPTIASTPAITAMPAAPSAHRLDHVAGARAERIQSRERPCGCARCGGVCGRPIHCQPYGPRPLGSTVVSVPRTREEAR